MGVTQVTIINASGSTPIEESSTWSDYVATVAKDSGRPVYWGRQEEDPSKIWVLSSWSNASEPGASSSLASISSTLQSQHSSVPPTSYCVGCSPSEVALTSPITEISVGFFRADNTAAAGFEQVVRDFNAKVEASGTPGAARGTNSAWTVEQDVEFPTLTGGSDKGVGFFSTLGWDSTAAHYVFNQTEVVQQNAGAIATAGVEGWVIAHVPFRKVAP